MSHGWSESDKKVVKIAVERARKRAEDQTLKEYREYPVSTINDLWTLELKIREWRRHVHNGFGFSYDTVEDFLHECLKKGWSELSDFQSLSEERRENIRQGSKLRSRSRQ